MATLIPKVVRKSDVHSIFLYSVYQQVSLPVHYFIGKKAAYTDESSTKYAAFLLECNEQKYPRQKKMWIIIEDPVQSGTMRDSEWRRSRGLQNISKH